MKNTESSEIKWKILRETSAVNAPVLKGGRLLLGYMGIIMILAGVITLLPLLTLFFYPEEMDQARFFIVPGIASMLAGYLLSQTLRGRKAGKLERNQEMVVVLGTWAIAIFVTALLFFGGIRLVLVMTSVLSDVYGMRLYHAEGHSDRLLPNLIESARLIIGIYSGYILGGTILYMVFGMSLFDAWNHAVAALSTGGFSTHPESIGYYDSPAVEIVTIVLMLLGSTNFFVHLLLLKGRLKDFFGHCETRLTLYLLACFVPVMAALLLGGLCGSLPESLRVALFQAVSRADNHRISDSGVF